MMSKVYIILDENEKIGVFYFVAKYVIIWEGLWRDRVVEMMDYYQVKIEVFQLISVS